MVEEFQAADVIVVPALDHLASSLADLIHALEKILSRYVSIRLLAESIEVSGPAAQLISAFVNFDRARLKVRTSKGQKAARP